MFVATLLLIIVHWLILDQEECEDNATGNKSETHCSEEEEEDEDFVVVIPDCFKLDVPLTGFTPPIEEPLSPVKTEELITFKKDEVVNNKQESVATVPCDNESPNTARKRLGGFGRDTLDNAWTSRSRNPLRYAVGVVNTVADLVDQHVHFASQKSQSTEDETTTASNTKPEEHREKDDAPQPSAPPLPKPEAQKEKVDAPQPSAPPLPIPSPVNICDITCQDPNISRYVNKKWEGPKPPETPMDHLISMGFANRDLNSRLLKKHKSNLQQAIQELLETNGDGYQDV